MKLTKNLITRDEALQLAPDYVKAVEGKGDFDTMMDKVLPKFEKLKKGQACITCEDGQFVKVKVSSVKRDCIQAVDGPVVRVGNGEYTWRVDGCDYAYPI